MPLSPFPALGEGLVRSPLRFANVEIGYTVYLRTVEDACPYNASSLRFVGVAVGYIVCCGQSRVSLWVGHRAFYKTYLNLETA